MMAEFARCDDAIDNGSPFLIREINGLKPEIAQQPIRILNIPREDIDPFGSNETRATRDLRDRGA
jgi:hypothetical protein